MKIININKIIGLLIVLFSSALIQAADEIDHIVAVVEDDVIMNSELQQRVRTVRDQLLEQQAPLPPTTVLEKQILDRLILTKLQIQMAEGTGIRVDDETLNRTISQIASENELTLEQFREILETDNYRYESFREDIRNEILLSRLRQRAVDNRVIVSDREIKNFLVNQQHQSGLEKEYRISHVLIALPELPGTTDLEQTRQLAEKVKTELKAGGDLAAIAATYSDGQQALEGGDLGWRKYSQVPTLFTNFIADMQKGDVSELIRSPSGYHIIKLMDERDSEEVVVTQTSSRHILIKPNEVISDDDARNRLLQLKQRIEGGDDFAELAKGNSGDTVSAADGGNLGWTSPGDLVPEFEAAMDELQPNQISEPIKTQYGWHIVQMLERRQHDSTEDVKRARARESIRTRKLDEAREAWLQQLRDDAYVEYRLD